MTAHAAPDFFWDAYKRDSDNAESKEGTQPSFVEKTTAVAAQAGSHLSQQVRDTASRLVITARNFLGVPYRRGGQSAESGFDCSGFTRHIFESTLGLLLPRRADEQAKATGLVIVKRNELKPGDLVFFNTLKRTFSHVGIYIGENKFIHAPRPGGEIRVEDMGISYWAKRFTGARRPEAAKSAASLLPDNLPPTSATTPAVTPTPALPENALLN